MVRSHRLLTDDELARVLCPAALPLPPRPKVVDIKFEDYQDSTGEDSLDIHVLIDEATPAEEQTWQAVKPIHEAVAAAVRTSGDPRYPYITVIKPSGYERRYSPDLADDE